MKKIILDMVHLLPQNVISKVAGKLAKSPVSKIIIPFFAKHYKINCEEAEKPVSDYRSINEFFTRRLSNGKRPLNEDSAAIVSPVDGVVAQIGKIENGTLLQAKGIHYELDKLIHHDIKRKLKNGYFMTVYLSPKDYHRIHSPFNAEITGYEYIPGRLFPVNDIGVHYVEGLFTKNERLTTFFNVNNGHAALVKVGALIVGSIQLSYEESVHQKHRGMYHEKTLHKRMSINKGEEIGWFEFGSTIILLLDEKIGNFREDMTPGISVKMGETIGRLTNDN
jgi:phosphatidylserine decarboxylase